MFFFSARFDFPPAAFDCRGLTSQQSHSFSQNQNLKNSFEFPPLIRAIMPVSNLFLLSLPVCVSVVPHRYLRLQDSRLPILQISHTPVAIKSRLWFSRSRALVAVLYPDEDFFLARSVSESGW